MTNPADRKDALLQAGLVLAAELSLPVVLQRIVDLAVELTDARYGALGVIGPDGELVEFVTTGISARRRKAIGHTPRGRGVLGHLITHPRPIRISAIAKHPKSVGFPPHHPPMKSFLGAPVRAMGKVFGNVYLTEKVGAPEFSAEDEASLVILATQAGVAFANASLYEETRRAQSELQRLGLLEERERIARELHDGIIQSLFAVGMALQAAGQLSGSPQLAERIERAVGELDRVIRDLRNYIFDLRPGILVDRRLDQALRELGREAQSSAGVTVDVKVDPGLAASVASRSHEIVQLTREALSNIVRHAHAHRASVSLARRNSTAVLAVQDDGIGFNSRAATRGSGLRNMRGRAAALGGTIRIASRPGRGTLISVTFPI